VSLNLRPTEKQLRDFSDVALCMCNIIGVVLFLTDKIPAGGLVCFCLGGVSVYLLSRIRVCFIKPLYQGMMLISFPFGWLISFVVMGLFYYGIITVVSVVFKFMGRDPLQRKYDKNAKTYWIPYHAKRQSEDYFHQF
jgi:hypothetical protein